jgi:hypothetical protein
MAVESGRGGGQALWTECRKERDLESAENAEGEMGIVKAREA